MTLLIEELDTMLVKHVLGLTEKRTTDHYTCHKLRQLSKGVTSLTPTELSEISTAEFLKCDTVLGAITTWSTKQQTALAALAVKVKKKPDNNDHNHKFD